MEQRQQQVDGDGTTATSAGEAALASRGESGLKNRVLLPLARVTAQWEKEGGGGDSGFLGREKRREKRWEVEQPIVRVSEAGRDGGKRDLFVMTPPPLDRE